VQTIAVSPDLEVYDGHQRLSALLTIHGKDYTVDARQSSRALTDEERRKLVIYLHSGAVGSWDWDALSGWNAQEVIGWGMDDAVLKDWKRDVTALGNMLDAEMPVVEDVEPQIDRAEELREKWGVESGQLWQLGEHRLICGDCTDRAVVEKVMGGENGLVFTDPPYGISVVTGGKVGGGGYTKFGKVGGENWVDSHNYHPIEGDETTETAQKFYSTCKEYGFTDFIIWGGNYFTDFLPTSRCWLVWDKQNTGNFADVELAWTSFDKGAKKYEWLWNGLSRKGERSDELVSRVHPTQKPVGLHKLIMQDFESEIVFDGFLGSGTTLIACERLNRKCRAIEISPAYVSVALQRWADLTGRTPELIQ
jgi:16S rRNA G966 N2-methylase RsmD